ncbi:MerR family transcriptional regulator [Longimicrobium sp.]|uniref:MerR family transcriptional regulator n=1 Tax=Longimicrobium sp. TaxID=2029185 RepID=UPI002E2F70FF|nr:MerR family transcriptional regulator [Longimicrobium sp.]HEX6037590.1 MerR family transcriptional regulator [Longimicrobium sp.]
MWKVGALAKQTGLSIRMLRYYDQIGLLTPSARTPSGHRLYGPDDLDRLQRVLSLRQLGFALEEIAECLRRPEFTLERVVELHLARVDEQIRARQRIQRRLETIAAHLRAARTVSVDEFIQTIEAITMSEKYLTPEQMREIDGHRELLDPARQQEVIAEWPRLIAQVREQMDAGADPASEPVVALARRWKALVHETTGTDTGTLKAVRTMYEGEPDLQARTGLDPRMFEYIGRAWAAAGAA